MFQNPSKMTPVDESMSIEIKYVCGKKLPTNKPEDIDSSNGVIWINVMFTL